MTIKYTPWLKGILACDEHLEKITELKFMFLDGAHVMQCPKCKKYWNIATINGGKKKRI